MLVSIPFHRRVLATCSSDSSLVDPGLLSVPSPLDCNSAWLRLTNNLAAPGPFFPLLPTFYEFIQAVFAHASFPIPVPTSSRLLDHLLANAYLIAMHDGCPVGFLLFTHNLGYGPHVSLPPLTIDFISVDSAHRRHAVGTALVRHLSLVAVRRGVPSLQLWVPPLSNVFGFCNKCGFIGDWDAEPVALGDSLGFRMIYPL